MVRLSNTTLDQLTVPGPGYDRSRVTTGIVHFGVGGFHRAHQAMYLDQLMGRGEAMEWGICGVGVMPFDLKMRDAMVGQDCLYTLVLKDPGGGWTPKIIGSIVEYLYAPDDPEAVIERMADPATRIVSLTVTEGGYNFSPVTGRFDTKNPRVVADLEPGATPQMMVDTMLRGWEQKYGSMPDVAPYPMDAAPAPPAPLPSTGGMR